MVRAKMMVAQITQYSGTPGARSVKLQAVTNGSPEDNTFAKFTPAATMEISITTPAAAEFFELGKAYYLDFSPAE